MFFKLVESKVLFFLKRYGGWMMLRLGDVKVVWTLICNMLFVIIMIIYLVVKVFFVVIGLLILIVLICFWLCNGISRIVEYFVVEKMVSVYVL